MNEHAEGELMEKEIQVDVGALAVLNRSEIDVQITTALRYPRSVTKFQGEALGLISLSEAIAQDCIYALPRGGKVIEGPSARFAEIMAYSWGNCRASARTIDEGREFVRAQGVFWDLEKNVGIGYEVSRRITNSRGERFNADMIGVTANAANSIALRNAILKGIPKALWGEMYDKARSVIMGDFKTLPNRRAAALDSFKAYGITPAQVFEKLEIGGEEDISLEHILVLRGLLTALKEGDTDPDLAFPKKREPGDAPRRGASGLKDALDKTGGEQGDPAAKGTEAKKPEQKQEPKAEEKAPEAKKEEKPTVREPTDDAGAQDAGSKGPTKAELLGMVAKAAAIKDPDVRDLKMDDVRALLSSLPAADQKEVKANIETALKVTTADKATKK